MKLTPLGVRGAYPIKNQATSSYLLSSGETNILLDLGSGALQKLLNIIDISRIDAIILSHLHNDHMADMLVLKYYIALKKLKKMTVYLPKCDMPMFDILSGSEEFELKFIQDNMDVKILDMQLKFFEMKHAVITYGVLVKHNGRAFAYSGDTALCQNIEKLASYADVLLLDTAVFKSEMTVGTPHMCVEDGVELARRFGCELIMTHFMSEDMLKYRKFLANGIYIAEEFKEFNI